MKEAIKEVREVTVGGDGNYSPTEKDVNELLANGWKLLDSSTHTYTMYDGTGTSITSFVLGRVE